MRNTGRHLMTLKQKLITLTLTLVMRRALTLTLLSAALLAGCSANDTLDEIVGRQPGQDHQPTEISLTTAIEGGGADTRVLTSASGVQNSGYFESSQPVDVFIFDKSSTNKQVYNGNGRCVYTTGASGTMSLTTPAATTFYWPSTGSGLDVYAYYPSYTVTSPPYASPGITSRTSSTAVTFTVQSDQSTVDAYRKSDYMYGTGSATDHNAIPITFTHKLHKVNFVLSASDDTGSQQFTKTDFRNVEISLVNVNLSTSITPNTGGVLSHSDITTGTSTIKVLKVDADADTSQDAPFCGSCIIPPQTVSTGMNLIEVLLDDVATPLYYTLPSSMTFASGEQTTFTLTITNSQIVLTSTVVLASWGAEQVMVPSYINPMED